MARQGNVDTFIYLNDFQKGINNLLDSSDVDNNTLVDALNVDITKQGKLQSRAGWTNHYETNDGHSLFSDNKNMYFIDGDFLKTLDKNKVEKIIDMGYKNLKTNYVKQNNFNSVIISNKNFIKRYYKDKIYNISPEQYNNTVLSFNAIPNGGFPKGKYRIALTFNFDNGIQGGSAEPLYIDLSQDNYGITLSNFQKTFDPNITTFTIYISEVNSISLFKYATYDINTTSVDLTYNASRGDELRKLFLEPMVSGEFIEDYKGVIFTAKDNMLYFSEKLDFNTDLANNYIEFEGNITLLVAQQDGLYVSDEYNVYFLSGTDAHKLERINVYDSPAIPHMVSKNIATNEIFFFTQMGQIVADVGGKINNITEEQFLPNKEMLEGSSIVMYQDGIRKIINTYKAGEANKTGIGDWAEVTIERGN